MAKLIVIARKLRTMGRRLVTDTNGAECCCGGACASWYMLIPCTPSGGVCDRDDYDVTARKYVCVGSKCASGSDYEPGMVIRNDGWCWRITSNEVQDPPVEDRIVGGQVCIDSCETCCGGAYLLPIHCEAPCGDSSRLVLLDPTDMDMTKCWYFNNLRIGDESCKCMYFGPNSRVFKGDTTGYEIITKDKNLLKEANTPEAACCECCHLCPNDCEYSYIDDYLDVTERPWCYRTPNNGENVPCCCGRTAVVIAVVMARSVRERSDYTGYQTNTRWEGFSYVEVEVDTRNNCAVERVVAMRSEVTSRDWGCNSGGCNEPGEWDWDIRNEWIGDETDGYGGAIACCRFRADSLAFEIPTQRLGVNVWEAASSNIQPHFFAGGQKCSGGFEDGECAEGCQCDVNYEVAASCSDISSNGRYNRPCLQTGDNGAWWKTRDEGFYNGRMMAIITDDAVGCRGGCRSPRPGLPDGPDGASDGNGRGRISSGDFL